MRVRPQRIAGLANWPCAPCPPAWASSRTRPPARPTACIAAYLAHAEPDGLLARGYTVSQGREIGYDARLMVQIDNDGIWVGGRTHTIIDGHAATGPTP